MSFRRFLSTAALAVALVAPTLPLHAGWKVLAVVKADKGLDRDEVNVASGRGFRKVKLKADGADVEVQSLHVVYANGELDKLEVRKVVRAGTTTLPLDLRGGERVIKKVILWYKTQADEKRKAIVTIYGED